MPYALAVAALVAVVVLPNALRAGSASARDGDLVEGRAVGTFDVDVDGDGTVDGAEFAVSAVVGEASTEGTFEFLMPVDPDEPPPSPTPTPAPSTGSGPPVVPAVDPGQMALEGVVDRHTELTQELATLRGAAAVRTGDATTDEDVPFEITVTEGGPGEGTLALALFGVLDGYSGDTEPDDGNYTAPLVTVTFGQLQVGTRPPPSPDPTTPPPPSSPPPTSPPPPPPTSPPPSPPPSTPPPPTSPPPPSPPPFTPPPPTDFPDPGDIPPYDPTSFRTSARLIAMLDQLVPLGIPVQDSILDVVAPFPVAGLASWSNDWHAYRCCPYPHVHEGIDIFALRGTPVVAVADGVISQKVDGLISGLAVELTDSIGFEYFYAHLEAIAPGVEHGSYVTEGQVLGYVGNTGNAVNSAPHLHFEVQPGGTPIPPFPFLDRWLAESEGNAFGLVRRETGQNPVIDPATLLPWLEQAQDLVSQAGEVPEEQIPLDQGQAGIEPTGSPPVTNGGSGASAGSAADPTRSDDMAPIAALTISGGALVVLAALRERRRQLAAAAAWMRTEREPEVSEPRTEEREPDIVVRLEESEEIVRVDERPAAIREAV